MGRLWGPTNTVRSAFRQLLLVQECGIAVILAVNAPSLVDAEVRRFSVLQAKYFTYEGLPLFLVWDRVRNGGSVRVGTHSPRRHAKKSV